MALVENLQREDLNPLEEAAGYQRLVEEFGYTQEQLSERVGKDRSTVANALRLLRLPESVRGLRRRGAALDGSRAGAARPRGGRGDGEAGAQDRRAASCRCGGSRSWCGARAATRTPPAPAAPAARRPSTSARDLAMRLTRALGTRVEVVEVGPGARPDRHPLPLARSARRAPRKAAALVSAAASLELTYRSDAALLVAYATHLSRGQLLLDTDERLPSGANVQLQLVAPGHVDRALRRGRPGARRGERRRPAAPRRR